MKPSLTHVISLLWRGNPISEVFFMHSFMQKTKKKHFHYRLTQCRFYYGPKCFVRAKHASIISRFSSVLTVITDLFSLIWGHTNMSLTLSPNEQDYWRNHLSETLQPVDRNISLCLMGCQYFLYKPYVSKTGRDHFTLKCLMLCTVNVLSKLTTSFMKLLHKCVSLWIWLTWERKNTAFKDLDDNLCLYPIASTSRPFNCSSFRKPCKNVFQVGAPLTHFSVSDTGFQ